MEQRTLGSQGLVVSAEGLARLDEVAPKGAAVGDRYTDMSSIYR